MSQIVKIQDTSMPRGLSQIIDQIPDKIENNIVLKFDRIFIYSSALVLLSTWRKSLPEGISVSIDDSKLKESAKQLLTNTGFREIIESDIDNPQGYSGNTNVPLWAIEHQFSREKAVQKISNMATLNTLNNEKKKAMKTMVSELCENIYAHSSFESTGYICAFLNHTTNKLEVALADSGIGIKGSYLDGTNENVQTRIRQGEPAIEIALEGRQSSRPREGETNKGLTHYGYGLFIVRRLIEENHGKLTIISGSDLLTIERFQRYPQKLSRNWQGTFVGLVIDITYPLPLEEIYASTIDHIVDDSSSTEEKQTKEICNNRIFLTREHNENQNEMRQLQLSKYGEQLLTREIGIQIRADIATALAGASQIKILLEGIEDITPSVADESFGKLAESMGKKVFHSRILFEGGHPIVSRLIDFVVKDRTAS